MHTFLWSGTDRTGNPRSVRIEAENAQQANQILSEQGWTSLKLVTDEVGDVARRHLLLPKDEGPIPPDTPEMEAARFKGWSRSFAGDWMKGLFGSSEGIGSLGVFGLILAAGIYTHNTWLNVIGAAGLVYVLLLFPATALFYSQTMRNLSKLHTAKVWGRWDEMLHRVEALKRSHRRTDMGVSAFELARNRAVALACMGRLQDGLSELAPFENDSTVPRWLYLGSVADVYDGARQFQRAVELRRLAAAEKPVVAAIWIDLAGSLVRGLNQPAEAREALARTESLEIPALAKPLVSFVQGVILWREGKPAEARSKLEKSLEGFQPYTHLELVALPVLLAKAYLCAVNGELGNRRKAEEYFREVEPFLVAHREEELLGACRRGLKHMQN